MCDLNLMCLQLSNNDDIFTVLPIGLDAWLWYLTLNVAADSTKSPI
jgi:hypothetical protein